jgi:RNA polymerase sigma factor (sigma-70 family)
MPHEVSVSELATRAMDGDQQAWRALVDRYHPLVRSVVRGYRLSAADTEDVLQTVWLRLVEHLADLRDAQALPKWLMTTARRECLRVLRTGSRTVPMDPLDTMPIPEQPDRGQVDDGLLAAERREALLVAFATLSDRHRELLLLLAADPPVPYAEISRRLAIPVGSIGPTRARALARLRLAPTLAGHLADAGAPTLPPQSPLGAQAPSTRR